MSEFPSMGATIFFGLIAVALLGHEPSEMPDPKLTHRKNGFQQDAREVVFPVKAAWTFPITLPDPEIANRTEPVLQMWADQAPVVEFALGPVRQDVQADMTHAVKATPPEERKLDAVLSAQDARMTRQRVSNSAFAIPGGLPPITQTSVARTVGYFDAPPLPVFVPLVSVRPVPSAEPVSLVASVRGSGPMPSVTAFDREQAPLRRPVAATVQGDAVHLRVRPDGAGESLGQYDRGTPAVILEIEQDWALTVIDGQITGWMFSRFVVPEPGS